MARLRAVLFDLDDTLTDRARSIERIVPEFVKRFGADLAECKFDEIQQCIHAGDGRGYAPREALCTHLQTSLNWRRMPDMEELLTFWRLRFPRCNVAREGAVATLKTLHRRGLKLGVVSNGSISSQYTKLDVMGIRPLLSVVLVSEEVGIKKPDPAIFEMALNKLSLLPSEVIFVGDNPVLDVAGARGVGIRAIWLNCDGDLPARGISCPERITSLEQILDLRID